MAELNSVDLADLLGSLHSMAESLDEIRVHLRTLAEAATDPEREVTHKIRLTVDQED